MKELLLFRHAKSDWENPLLSDHDRPLNKRGQNDAPEMGELVKKLNILPDLVFVSSAKRTQQTFQLWSRTSGYNGVVITKREFYLSSARQYIKQIQEHAGQANRVLVIGHNPVMEELTASLISGSMDADVIFPTAAMAFFDVMIADWKKLETGTAKLRWLITPDMLKTLNE